MRRCVAGYRRLQALDAGADACGGLSRGRHAYTSTVADVFARFSRACGRDVFFLTGTDEHGLKVEQSAAKRGVPPQLLADENSAVFRDVAARLNISFDHFIRTTDEAHTRQVGALVSQLQASGSAYLGTFEGWYDAGQEEYFAESKAKELDYKSPVTGRDLVRATEDNYYFRLSAFQERLLHLFETRPDWVQPAARRNEMLSRLREGLQDVPISRTNFSWGIPMPGDSRHVIYVWIDALMNYITALGLGEAEGHEVRAARAHYWPATLHVMAKEIAWFHAVIWPAMLMALDLPLPGRVYAHAFWIRDGVKMSKSLGNFVDLDTLQRYIHVYGLDAVRYYLIVDGPLGATGMHTHTLACTALRGRSCARRPARRHQLLFGAAARHLQLRPGEHGRELRVPRHRHGWQVLRRPGALRPRLRRRLHRRRRRRRARGLAAMQCGGGGDVACGVRGA